MSKILFGLALSLTCTTLLAEPNKEAQEISTENQVVEEVDMAETVITPLNAPEEDMFKLPEDATPSLVAKKRNSFLNQENLVNILQKFRIS